MTADEWPELPHSGPTEGLQRLSYWQEKRRVEELLEKRRRGIDLAAHEEAAVAYSPFGSASRCGY